MSDQLRLALVAVSETRHEILEPQHLVYGSGQWGYSRATFTSESCPVCIARRSLLEIDLPEEVDAR